jgi:hypothetical protein
MQNVIFVSCGCPYRLICVHVYVCKRTRICGPTMFRDLRVDKHRVDTVALSFKYGVVIYGSEEAQKSEMSRCLCQSCNIRSTPTH